MAGDCRKGDRDRDGQRNSPRYLLNRAINERFQLDQSKEKVEKCYATLNGRFVMAQ
jgi:hypothetical protein